MMLNTSQESNQRVEGVVIIKRKAFWVKRYAKVENLAFSYKKDKSKSPLASLCRLEI